MIVVPEWYIKPVNIFDDVEKTVESGEPFAIMLIGSFGCGKTTLADAVYSHIVKANAENRRFSSIYTNAPTIYQEYLEALELHGQDKIDALKDIYQYFNRSLVVIDDLGTEPTTEAAHNLFATLFCNQYDEYRRGVRNKCIITTNFGRDAQTKAYGGRVVDRITEYYAIKQYTSGSMRKPQHALTTEGKRKNA